MKFMAEQRGNGTPFSSAFDYRGKKSARFFASSCEPSRSGKSRGFTIAQEFLDGSFASIERKTISSCRWDDATTTTVHTKISLLSLG